MWDAERADLAFQKLCEKTTGSKIQNITVGPERRQNSLPRFGVRQGRNWPPAMAYEGRPVDEVKHVSILFTPVSG